LIVEKTYTIPFSVEAVYAAWVSSKTVIAPATNMDIDPVVGGHYRLIMQTDEFSGRNEGTFLAVEPDQHLKYTWEWNGDGEVTEIDVRFLPTREGTVVHIVHSGFTSEARRAQHDSGWDTYIQGFTAHLRSRR
jgi:uncharacterized protein YndB with AHSA1/START domain